MKSKRAIKSPQNQERIKNLKLNVLVLSADLTPFTIGLSKKPTLPDRRHLQPLNEYHLPSEFANKEQLTPVYTDFTD